MTRRLSFAMMIAAAVLGLTAGALIFVGQARQEAARPPRPIETPTPIYVTTLPGITERQIRETPRVVNCTLTPGQQYETRRVLFMENGGKYALIRTAGGCNGWTWIGY